MAILVRRRKNSGKIKSLHQLALTVSCTTFRFPECRGTAYKRPIV